MKPLNRTATKTFQAIIDRIPAGATSAVLDQGDQAHGGAIMALHVELVGQNKLGKLYSFAHYYEENGDLMRDPDVVMLRTAIPVGMGWPGLLAFYPISYRQDGLGIDREYVIFSDDCQRWKIHTHMQADLASFCNGWARNLRDQQQID